MSDNQPGPLWPSMLPSKLHGLDSRCSVAAKGVRIRYADGAEKLCGTSGLWNVNLGYGNAVIAKASADALHEASYLSVYQWENVYARNAAAALVELCGAEHYGRVMFSTSGGAANDLAVKMARHYHSLRGDGRRKGLIALDGGWHGLTYGAFALTGVELGQSMYGVDRRLVAHVPPNDPARLEALLDRNDGSIAAVVVEPVVGEGAIPLTSEYVSELLRLRTKHGFLLVADEVATGFGRTGTFFASQRWPEHPDLLITSKGLTNGTSAAAAVVVSQAVAEVFTASGAILAHGETQAGTPVSCAAILATISEMHQLDALANGLRLSARLDTELARIVAEEPLVAATTGIGCFRSLRLGTKHSPMPEAEIMTVIAEIWRAGAIVHHAPGGFQLLPALVYSDAELDELLGCVRSGLAEHARNSVQ